MAEYTIYGIKSCDTMKKAMTWLQAQNLDFELHDYKKAGIDEATLKTWLNSVGPDVLVNRRGTTWRKLSDEDKAACDSGDPDAIARVLAANTSAIKRPVLPLGEQILVGFKEEEWREAI
ncbi:MAG: Spx/MgsR family RNA polymerase-binding regulatory protein [Natronospirillum sp.]|uniref:Spx/MgsR family RNA polymerase-binding regulatory protein n=1 Tax=Natronospirillum sp. TaxID=2812955 RepID=UPI0025E8BA69|nr:Spx/MgsR family RNA polymerase-binding regulatory protein [Natronospirillum sp.]MCH8552974.1 Spx/MgsR family RNA polymerase-binding regulatory protein [Natronospirillum sp.]